MFERQIKNNKHPKNLIKVSNEYLSDITVWKGLEEKRIIERTSKAIFGSLTTRSLECGSGLSADSAVMSRSPVHSGSVSPNSAWHRHPQYVSLLLNAKHSLVQ